MIEKIDVGLHDLLEFVSILIFPQVIRVGLFFIKIVEAALKFFRPYLVVS
jgi:hypothetical protein